MKTNKSLQKLINKKKKEFFTKEFLTKEPSSANLNALGIIISQYCEWVGDTIVKVFEYLQVRRLPYQKRLVGDTIVKVFEYALEDANHHMLRDKISMLYFIYRNADEKLLQQFFSMLEKYYTKTLKQHKLKVV